MPPRAVIRGHIRQQSERPLAEMMPSSAICPRIAFLQGRAFRRRCRRHERDVRFGSKADIAELDRLYARRAIVRCQAERLSFVKPCLGAAC